MHHLVFLFISVYLLSICGNPASGSEAEPDRPLQVSGGEAVKAEGYPGILEHYPYAVLEAAEYNFGRVTAGSVLAGIIVISNEGAADLLVAKVRSSCGLMIPSWPTQPTPRGENIRISFRYDSSRTGPFERLITIHTNAWQKDLVVKVRGEVIPPPE
jgi:hypothetical protein